MGARSILPLIDLVFLTLGAILAAMTEMERVTALPVEVARVAEGGAVVRQGDFAVLTIDFEGLALEGRPVTLDEAIAELTGREVVVRGHRELRSEILLAVVAELAAAGADVSLEVTEGDQAMARALRRRFGRPAAGQ